MVSELIHHFKRISTAEGTHNKELVKTFETFPEPLSTYQYFEKNGSIPGIGKLLTQQMSGRVTHSNNIMKAIDGEIIPELEETESLLKEKTREIRGMSGDFKNDLTNGLSTSRASLLSLQEAITDWEANNGHVSHDKDPFVVDLAARKNMRSTLGEEQYLHESTVNIMASSQKLEAIVVNAIKRALAKYNNLVSQEAAELAVMSQMIEDNIVTGQLDNEWPTFAADQTSQGNLIDPTSKPRSLETVQYQGKDHTSTIPVCDGWLEKKSGLLSGYATSFYIISPSRYLHEFKSNDLRVDTVPTLSLYLPNCELGHSSKESDKAHKFVLKGKQLGSALHSEHTWTFRAKDRAELQKWYDNIGKASDPSFTYGSSSTAPRTVKAPVIPLEDDEADETPFRGPETLVVTPAAATILRPSAGRFDSSTGFSSPWGAAVSGLNAQPVRTPSRRDSESSRIATTSYGVAPTTITPVTSADHDEHIRQASTNSAAAGFMDKEILDDNAYLDYDKEHGTHSTLVGDEDFKPADADVNVPHTKSEDTSSRPRRSSSLAFREVSGSPASSAVPGHRPRPAGKTPSRKATATYGDMSNLPLPAMTEEALTPEPKSETYRSPYFPAPGEGTSSGLTSNDVNDSTDSVTVVQPRRASVVHSGAATPLTGSQYRAPQRKMSLSDQIMMSSTPAASNIEPLAAYDAAPHIRIGTQSNEARYKVGSRRGSQSASGVNTPSDATMQQSALDSTTSDTLAARLKEPSTGEKARARTPSRGASFDNLRKPPSRGSSLSLGGQGGTESPNLLNTINEAFEKDLAAAKGNQPGDAHIPGEFPKTPSGIDSKQL